MNGPDVLHLVTCGNSAYALGASVTVRSAAEHLSAGVRLKLHFLDNGITAADWLRMNASWSDLPVEAFRVIPNETLLRTLPLKNPAEWGYYTRLFLAELLPADVDRVIYLDSDTLVVKDLTRLRDEPLGDALLAAALDNGTPTVHGTEARVKCKAGPLTAHEARALERRIPASRVPNHAALGIPPTAPYFNAGVFTAHLSRWRAENLAGRFTACLRDHAAHVRLCDQYALNVVPFGRIRRLDARWNVMHHLDFAYDPAETGLSPTELETTLRDPWIIHYVGPAKPWRVGYPWLHQPAYLEVLARTAWASDRPSAFAEWMHHRRRRLGSLFRKFIRGCRGKAKA